MKRPLRITLKIAGAILGLLLVALAVAALVLNSTKMQNRFAQKATAVLTEELQTQVGIGHVELDFIKQQFKLSEVRIEDRQQRELFCMKSLDVSLAVWPLLHGELRISKASIVGLRAELHNDTTDSVANYQFILDALKKKPSADSIPDKEQRKKEPMVIDIKKVVVKDVEAQYNDARFTLGSLRFVEDKQGRRQVQIGQANGTWNRMTKRGEVQHLVGIKTLTINERDERKWVEINGLRFATDNHKPRKNTGKPKRGFFDVGHLDFTANVKLTVTHADKDSIAADLTHAEIHDSVSGIHIQELQATLQTNKRQLFVQDMTLRWDNTQLQFDHGVMQLPSRKEGRPLSYSTSEITGKTLLKDISRTFAPVLSRFTIPVQLSTRLEGTDEGMQFHDVHVQTVDKRLDVWAEGYIRELKDKYKMVIHFDIHRMSARKGVAQDIINQFPVKKFMMKQLKNLGTIGYRGQMDILWKQEKFRGQLSTEVGNLDFNFTLNDQRQYLTGSVRSDSVKLGRALDMEKIGTVAANADFQFDISKQRTAQMRRQKGGKLPIGSVNAFVKDAAYGKIKVHNVTADIVSDGAEATGKLAMRGRHTDLLCSFVFNNTENLQKMKIKPGIRFHGLSDEDRAQKEQEKQAKQQAKEERKQQKAIEKAQRKQQKEAEKEQRRLQKEAKKAAKAAKEDTVSD